MKPNTDFIERSTILHKNKYDYSEVVYINAKTKINIKCPTHGFFEQTPDSHLHKHGCPRCRDLESKIKQQSNIDEFIVKAMAIHGNKYNYSEVVYNNNRTKIKINCPIHGIFEQIPINHIGGKQGCPICKFELLRNLYLSNTEDFIKKATLIHGEKYNYSDVIYITYNHKIKIICPDHGIFFQRAGDHLRKCGCPKCNRSRGEETIEKYLIKHNIKYNSQHSFPNCKHKKILYFDFYLIDLNICIEYDGELHFIIKDFFGGEEGFKQTQIRDAIKTKYCEDNNIPLLRIKYNENIEDKLNNYLFFKPLKSQALAI